MEPYFSMFKLGLSIVIFSLGLWGNIKIRWVWAMICTPCFPQMAPKIFRIPFINQSDCITFLNNIMYFLFFQGTSSDDESFQILKKKKPNENQLILTNNTECAAECSVSCMYNSIFFPLPTYFVYNFIYCSNVCFPL